MSPPLVQLEVDGGERLQVGGRVTGTVVVTPARTGHGLVLTLKLRRKLRLESRTVETEEPIWREELAKPFVAGETVRRPFDVVLPAGLPSVEARRVAVRWELVAVGAVGGDVERPALPLTLFSSQGRLSGVSRLDTSEYTPRRRKRLLAALGTAASLGVGLGVSGTLNDPELTIIGLKVTAVAGVLVVGAGAIGLPLAWWLDRRERRFALELTAPLAALPGRPLQVGVKVGDAGGAELRSAVVSLCAREWKDGPATVTSAALVQHPRRLARGDGFSARAELTVPPGAAPSLEVRARDVDLEPDGSAPDGRLALVHWWLRLDVDIGRRRLRVEQPLVVATAPPDPAPAAG